MDWNSTLECTLPSHQSIHYGSTFMKTVSLVLPLRLTNPHMSRTQLTDTCTWQTIASTNALPIFRKTWMPMKTSRVVNGPLKPFVHSYESITSMTLKSGRKLKTSSSKRLLVWKAPWLQGSICSCRTGITALSFLGLTSWLMISKSLGCWKWICPLVWTAMLQLIWKSSRIW
jgi:hypothetical protein